MPDAPEEIVKHVTETANTEPTNAELKEIIEEHTKNDETFQATQESTNQETAKSLASIHKRMNGIPTKEETAKIVEDALIKILLGKGRAAYSFVIGTSILIGALVVIFGGFQTVLGWLGFHQMLKP